MKNNQKCWTLQSILLYAPFMMEFAAYPLFMLIQPEWLGGLLFWVFYTYIFYGLAIFAHMRWRQSIGSSINWEINCSKALLAVLVGIVFSHLQAFFLSESQVPMIIRDFNSALQTEPLMMGIGRFVLQNIYYAFEFTLVACIIDCAQTASEKLGGTKNIPWGGVFLGLTWGLGHAMTKGVFAYGLGSMVLSIVAGFAYIKLGKKPTIAWAVIAAAYLL